MKFYKKYLPLLELNHSKFSVIALTGGRGSMKTGHALRGILVCSMLEKKKTCFFRETRDTLANSIKAELDGIIDEDFERRGYTYTNESVKHVNGSYMFFKGLKEVNKAAIENLKGIATTTDFFVVDEAQAVSKAVWDVLIPTLRKAGCVLIVIYNRVDNNLPVEEVLFLDYENMKAPTNTYFIEVNYPEILHLGLLSHQFVERAELLRVNKPDEYDQYYLNKPNAQHIAKVVKYYDKNKVVQNINYCIDEDLHITCDFNVDPMSWAIAHKDEKNVYFIDEIVIEGTDVKSTVKEFLNRYPGHIGKIIINGDASGDNRDAGSDQTKFVQLRNALYEHGYTDVEIKIRHGNPRIINRIDAFNSRMLTNAGETCIFISPKCKWLLYNCQNLAYKPGTSIIDTPSQTVLKNDSERKFLGHIYDAASYLIEMYWPINAEYLKKHLEEVQTIWEKYS